MGFDMASILTRLNRGETLVADGGMGSMILARSRHLVTGSCTESLNLSHPEILGNISRQYLEAGAQLVQTNTFGGSPLRLKDFSLEHEVETINRNAVAVVKNAVKKYAHGTVYIMASCGPSVKKLKPEGTVSSQEMGESFARQFRVLIDEGADVINIETMTDIREAVIAVNAAKSVSASIPVIASMFFHESDNRLQTPEGVTIPQAVRQLEEAGADVIGSNCGNGIESMIPIARQFKECTRLPIIIQANAGIPRMIDGKAVYSETPEFMAGKSNDLLDAGVSIIGGCCGTTPAHIKAIVDVVRLYR